MHIEDIQKDADPLETLALDSDGRNVSDLTVSRGNNRSRFVRNGALGIAKKPKKERRERKGNNRPPGTGQPTNQ